MSLLDALLGDIKDNPDDDTPRLVYADWLEERGDTDGARRAELLGMLVVGLALGVG